MPVLHTVPSGALVTSHRLLQASPTTLDVMQIPPQSQESGQLPSHISPASTTPLPQVGLQSLSLFAFAFAGQHPSPFTAVVICMGTHAASHRAALPVSISRMQPEPALQELGQLPSQASPGSFTPFPHLGSQSLSELAFAPDGQHPSPLVAAVIGVCTHAALHCAALPVSVSFVQELPSSQEVGQGLSALVASQSSGGWTMP